MNLHTEAEKKLVMDQIKKEVANTGFGPSVNLDPEVLREALSVGLSPDELKSTELTRYIAMATVPPMDSATTWWRDNEHSFPGLSSLARKYLAVPASSVPSERMFSSAGNLAEKRSHLDPDVLERDVLLHHYLNERKRLDAFKTVPTTIPVLNIV